MRPRLLLGPMLGLMMLMPAGAQAQTHVCGAGPGPGEVQVGENAGGNGVAPTPMCDWAQGPARTQQAPRTAPKGPITAAEISNSGILSAGEILRDKELVRRELAPPETVKIDMEMLKMISEGEAILSSGEKAKAQAWTNEYKILLARKIASYQQFLAKKSRGKTSGF